MTNIEKTKKVKKILTISKSSKVIVISKVLSINKEKDNAN